MAILLTQTTRGLSRVRKEGRVLQPNQRANVVKKNSGFALPSFFFGNKKIDPGISSFHRFLI